MAGIDCKAELKSILQSINPELDEKDVQFLLENSRKLLDRPDLLVKKFMISREYADKIVKILKKATETIVQITEEDAKKIDESLRKDPSMNTPFELSFTLNIDEKVVAAYLESKQEPEIQDEGGECSRLHFSGKEGKKVLSIIKKYFPNDTEENIRISIVNDNLIMKDKLICVMKTQSPKEYSQLVAYLAKFKDSKKFENVDDNLTFEEMKMINESNHNVVELSNKLNKVDTVIRAFIERFLPEEVEECGYKQLQCNNVTEMENKFGRGTITFHKYRMIAVDPIKDVFSMRSDDPTEKFERLLPWIFYYLKCYLSLNEITKIVYKSFQTLLTAHQVFHMVFQHSDSLLRGFCIEHYSYSNPVPLYYPTFTTYKNKECYFEVCKELWYSIRENKGVISFGLGQAAFDRVGKSSLLDLIFETDFAEGNPVDSPFHFKSIDIQMTNNLYAADTNECTQWAFIDCNGYVQRDVIRWLCHQLEVAIIHVSYHDYTQNKQQIKTAINKFNFVDHVYVFVRDYNIAKYKKVTIDKKCYIFISNIVRIFFEGHRL